MNAELGGQRDFAERLSRRKGDQKGMERAAERLARALALADADARYRCALLQRRCEELERVLDVLERGTESFGGSADREEQQEQLAEVGQSIQDAIDRARRARDEMAARAKAPTDSEESSDGDGGAEETSLEGILTLARRIRDVQPGNAAEEQPRAKPVKSATKLADTRNAKEREAPRMHVEYPRKLKFVVDQLEDKRADPFRFAFCCKVNEHLSMSQARRRLLEDTLRSENLNNLGAPIARIQAPFPKQVERLGRAYARLEVLVREKLGVNSTELQTILQSPSLSRLFPFCARLKLVKQMQRLLDTERKDLAARLPNRPVLSNAAKTHRDTTLSRLRSKRPQSTQRNRSAISNDPLVKATAHSIDRELLDALDDAWTSEGSDYQRAHSTKVRELVLNDTSNLILAAFKQLFVEAPEPPGESDVAKMMRLVRLVDSIALSRGRRFRSIVAPDSADDFR